MAGLLDEFNPAVPSPVTYCKRISVADYEWQGAEETQSELEKLLQHLDKNPQQYYQALRKRKRDELNLFSWLKVTIMSAVQGEEVCLDSYFPEGECREQLDILKRDLVSAYDYGQEALGNGKRFSKRLAEKRKQAVMDKFEKLTKVQVPPPPPPIMPVKHRQDKDTEDIENRRPKERQGSGNVREDTQDSRPAQEQISTSNLKNINDQLFTSMRNVSGRGQPKPTVLEVANQSVHEKAKIQSTENPLLTMEKQTSNVKTMRKILSKKLSKNSLQENLNDEITNARKKLKCIYPQSNTDDMTTPYRFSKQQREAKRTPDQYPLFNVALVHKFRNARSPESPCSPSGCFNDSSEFYNDSLA